MRLTHSAFYRGLILFISLLAVAAAQSAETSYQPMIGQEGKDVVWVPTAPVVVEKMLDVAQMTPQDFVIDLGSGDGRNVIAAAKRGAQALGIEFNPELVELSQQRAAAEGVADKARFVKGDMFEADISQATVLALYLLPRNLERLLPRFLELRPGTRIVLNSFGIENWKPDATEHGEGDCPGNCLIRLYVVPARVAGVWRLPSGELKLGQRFQLVTGVFNVGGVAQPISNGKLRGEQITFSAGGVDYVGSVTGESMRLEARGGGSGGWTAARVGN